MNSAYPPGASLPQAMNSGHRFSRAGVPLARPAGRMNPRDPDPFTLQAKVAVQAFLDYSAHDLVARNHGQYARRGATFNLVQLGVADAAGMNADQDFRVSCTGRGNDIELQWDG